MENIHKIDKQAKLNLLATTFALAVFTVLVLNVLISIMYLLELIKEPDYDSIWLSFQDGYYTINDNKMGVPIFFNFLGVLFFLDVDGFSYPKKHQKINNLYLMIFLFNLVSMIVSEILTIIFHFS